VQRRLQHWGRILLPGGGDLFGGAAPRQACYLQAGGFPPIDSFINHFFHGYAMLSLSIYSFGSNKRLSGHFGAPFPNAMAQTFTEAASAFDYCIELIQEGGFDPPYNPAKVLNTKILDPTPHCTEP
jgi:hypothetical protein